MLFFTQQTDSGYRVRLFIVIPVTVNTLRDYISMQRRAEPDIYFTDSEGRLSLLYKITLITLINIIRISVNIFTSGYQLSTGMYF